MDDVMSIRAASGRISASICSVRVYEGQTLVSGAGHNHIHFHFL